MYSFQRGKILACNSTGHLINSGQNYLHNQAVLCGYLGGLEGILLLQAVEQQQSISVAIPALLGQEGSIAGRSTELYIHWANPASPLAHRNLPLHCHRKSIHGARERLTWYVQPKVSQPFPPPQCSRVSLAALKEKLSECMIGLRGQNLLISVQQKK